MSKTKIEDIAYMEVRIETLNKQLKIAISNKQAIEIELIEARRKLSVYAESQGIIKKSLIVTIRSFKNNTVDITQLKNKIKELQSQFRIIESYMADLNNEIEALKASLTRLQRIAVVIPLKERK